MVKKVSERTSRSEIAERKAVVKLIQENKWNPFKRADPKVLEILHRQTTTKKQLLDEHEESPI